MCSHARGRPVVDRQVDVLGSLFKALAASSEVLEIEVPDLDHQIQYISLSVPDDSQEHLSVSSSHKIGLRLEVPEKDLYRLP